jgi:uncharacterized protein DUF2865
MTDNGQLPRLIPYRSGFAILKGQKPAAASRSGPGTSITSCHRVLPSIRRASPSRADPHLSNDRIRAHISPRNSVHWRNIATGRTNRGTNFMGVKLPAASCSVWCKTFLVGALIASAVTGVPDGARAEGPLDSLFPGFQQPEAPPPPASRATSPNRGQANQPAEGRRRVSGTSSGGGRSVAFCVRLCDGQHFRIRQLANGTAENTCNAICPYSQTKLFFGGEIRSSVAKDGQRYTQLETAFRYTKKQTANCTCNGRDPFGLVPLGVKDDPTLRAGDLVSTSEGLMTFGGRYGQGDAFTPVDPVTLPKNLRPPLPQ